MKNWVWLIGFYIKSSVCSTPISTPIQPWIFTLNPTWNGNLQQPYSTTFCNFRNSFSLAEIQELSVVQTLPKPNAELFATVESVIFHSPSLFSTEINYHGALKIENQRAILLGLGLQKIDIQNNKFYNSTSDLNQNNNRILPVFQIGYLSSNLLSNNPNSKHKSKLNHCIWITLGKTNLLQNINTYQGNIFNTQLRGQIDSNFQFYQRAKFPYCLDYQLEFASQQLKIPVYLSFHYEQNNTYFNSNFLIALKSKKQQFIDLQIAISNTPLGFYYIQNQNNWFLRIGGNWHPQLGISPSFQWLFRWNKLHKKA